jgi:predicted nucleic acid-binding protein
VDGCAAARSAVYRDDLPSGNSVGDRGAAARAPARGLEIAALAMFREDFAGRILAFDSDAAVIYAALFAVRRAAGRPTATADLMIAAIARTRGASVVTRDSGDFEACGLILINPWAEA